MLADQERTIVMARDISQRKRYEIELAQSRDFLTKTINAVPEPLSVKDSDLNVVLVNDAFCETHNVLRDQVIGKTAETAMPQSCTPETSAHEQQVFQTGERHAAFEAFIDVNNEQFILSTYRSTFQDQTNDQTYVVAVSRDVTAEMKRENRLQLLASVFKNAQEGVAILNPDGTICEANPEFIATIGKAHAKNFGHDHGRCFGLWLATVFRTHQLGSRGATLVWQCKNAEQTRRRNRLLAITVPLAKPTWRNHKLDCNVFGHHANRRYSSRITPTSATRQFDEPAEPKVLPPKDCRHDRIGC